MVEKCPTCLRAIKKKESFRKPKPFEVVMYAKSIGFLCDGEKFCAFYDSKGWVIGKSPMKSWKAAVRTWKCQATPDKLFLVNQSPEIKQEKMAQKEKELKDRAEREYFRIHSNKLAEADQLVREKP